MTRLIALATLLLARAIEAAAVEHSGVVPEDAECTSRRAAKISGKSAHSVMATLCGVCHLTQTEGDLKTVSLSMPKQKICSACRDAGGVAASCACCEGAMP